MIFWTLFTQRAFCCKKCSKNGELAFFEWILQFRNLQYENNNVVRNIKLFKLG